MAVLTEAARIAEYGICGDVPVGYVALWTGDSTTYSFRTNADLVPAWEVFRDILKRHRYWVDTTQTGSYNCRHIGNDPSKPWSPHASASAFDINWRRNPATYEKPFETMDLPPEMVQEIVNVRTVSGVQVFRWGGDWDSDGSVEDTNFFDPMHFEIIAEKEHLATGFIGGSMLSFGATGQAVRISQVYLNRMSEHRGLEFELVVDGEFGDATKGAVLAAQGWYGLPATGAIDGILQGLLATYGASIVLPGHAAEDHDHDVFDHDHPEYLDSGQIIDLVVEELTD